MTIAGITIDDNKVIAFEFVGMTENNRKNISQNGAKRDNVLISRAYNYTLELAAIDKQTLENLHEALETKAETYQKITLDIAGIVRAETIGQKMITSLDFEFDMNTVSYKNQGGCYDVTIPMQYIEYF